MTGNDDLTAQGVTAQDATPRTTRAPWQAVVLEVTAALVAAGAVVLFPLHYVGARLAFLGDEAVIHDENVRFYWILVGVLAVAVVTSLATALRRRGGKAFAWHVLVAVAGLVMATGFSVTEAGPVRDVDRAPLERVRPDQPGGSACHSGGDSDECLGG